MEKAKGSIAKQPTWVALSTPQGKAALAVIRLSGAQSFPIVQRIFKGKALGNQHSHTLHYGHIQMKGHVIDEVVVGLFRAPKSYTGEDMVEISCHGAPYIVQQTLDWLCEAGAELAPPGGFSQRAFLNGKMDLVQAEAVADLIQAETKFQHQIAIQQLKGRLSNRLTRLRQLLLDANAYLTLSLDFAEEDVAFAKPDAIYAKLAYALKEIHKLTRHFDMAQRLKEGFKVAIIGRPNVGKSTLLNALCMEDRAIVSANPGTTRDSVEASVQLNGLSFRFVDTAGLRHARGKVEQLGVERSVQQAQQARLILYVFDARKEPKSDIMNQFNLIDNKKTTLMVANKADLISDKRKHLLTNEGAYLCISAQKGTGLQSLKAQISAIAADNMPTPESVWITRARHKQQLEQAQKLLIEAQKGLRQRIPPELIAHNIEQACRCVGEITGHVTHEDVLSHIFQHFCIGK